MLLSDVRALIYSSFFSLQQLDVIFKFRANIGRNNKGKEEDEILEEKGREKDEFVER